MVGAGVIPGFFHDFFDGSTSGHEVTVNAYVPTPKNFCHLYLHPPTASPARADSTTAFALASTGLRLPSRDQLVRKVCR